MDDQTATIKTVPAESPRSPISTAIFDRIEHSAYVAVGVLISVVGLISLGDAVLSIYRAFSDWHGVVSIGEIIERLLFVLMLAEILHTVRASMQSGGLSAEPFLIVGMIACIRRILVSTLESEASMSAAQTEAMQRTSMIELGVLGFLILSMVVSIYMLRRARAISEQPAPPARRG